MTRHRSDRWARCVWAILLVAAVPARGRALEWSAPEVGASLRLEGDGWEVTPREQLPAGVAFAARGPGGVPQLQLTVSPNAQRLGIADLEATLRQGPLPRGTSIGGIRHVSHQETPALDWRTVGKDAAGVRTGAAYRQIPTPDRIYLMTVTWPIEQKPAVPPDRLFAGLVLDVDAGAIAPGGGSLAYLKLLGLLALVALFAAAVVWIVLRRHGKADGGAAPSA